MAIVCISVVTLGIVRHTSSDTMMKTLVIPSFSPPPLFVSLSELVTFPPVPSFLYSFLFSFRLLSRLVLSPSRLDNKERTVHVSLSIVPCEVQGNAQLVLPVIISRILLVRPVPDTELQEYASR